MRTHAHAIYLALGFYVCVDSKPETTQKNQNFAEKLYLFYPGEEFNRERRTKLIEVETSNREAKVGQDGF